MESTKQQKNVQGATRQIIAPKNVKRKIGQIISLDAFPSLEAFPSLLAKKHKLHQSVLIATSPARLSHAVNAWWLHTVRNRVKELTGNPNTKRAVSPSKIVDQNLCRLHLPQQPKLNASFVWKRFRIVMSQRSRAAIRFTHDACKSFEKPALPRHVRCVGRHFRLAPTSCCRALS